SLSGRACPRCRPRTGPMQSEHCAPKPRHAPGWRCQPLSGQVCRATNDDRPMRSSTSATLSGSGAILLWSSLASLTVLKGVVPPLQTTAIAFAIGGLVLVAAALLRGRSSQLAPTRASLALGIYGLFCYHALYFAALRLAPAAEASLIT